jgi:3-oxoacyl-[acyl-carrier protein] reductase
MRLKGKVAIITGGARGIGKGTAVRFAKEGAKVVVCDFDEAAGGNALFVKVDVTNRDQINAVVAATMEKYGRIDVLVNNAGITADATLGKMTEEQWDRVIDINLKGAKAAAARLIEKLRELKVVIVRMARECAGTGKCTRAGFEHD